MRPPPSCIGRPALAALALLGLLLPLLGGCESTGLRRVAFTLRAAGVSRPGDQAGPLAFTTAAGWEVSLEEARVAVGPVYLDVAPPPDYPAPPSATTSGLRRLRSTIAGALLAEARADAGQDQLATGRVIGQVTRRVIVDALAPADVEVGAGDGTSERALSARLRLLPQDAGGGGGELPRASVAYVLGEARRGADLVRFAAYLPLDDAAVADETLAQLRAAGPILVGPEPPAGQPPAGVVLDDGLVLRLRVDPRPWLDRADFSDLVPYAAGPDGRKRALPTDSVLRSLRSGVRLRGGVYEILRAAP